MLEKKGQEGQAGTKGHWGIYIENRHGLIKQNKMQFGEVPM